MDTAGYNSCIPDKYPTTAMSTTNEFVELIDSDEYTYDSNELIRYPTVRKFFQTHFFHRIAAYT